MPHRETGVGVPVDLLASPVRRALVDTLVSTAQLDPEHPGRMAADVAALHGLHVTTARFHLDQLVAAGILEAHFERSARAGRPRKLYTVAAGTLSDSTASDTAAYKALAELLTATFARAASGAITPADAGREWARQHVPADASGPARSPGQWLGKLGRLVDVLRDWGYSPEVATSDDGRQVSVNLVDCPFLDLARDNPAVVCGIHRGLIAGTLAQLGEERTEVSLEPFVAPNRCLAHVRTTTAFAEPPRPDPPRRAA